jgi:hypothetical protein
MSGPQFETIDEQGNPPKSRLSDAAAAFEIWGNLREADRKASYNRARIDAAYDNDKPYNDQLFQTNGQDYRVNVAGVCPGSRHGARAASYRNAVHSFSKCPTNTGTRSVAS